MGEEREWGGWLAERGMEEREREDGRRKGGGGGEYRGQKEKDMEKDSGRFLLNSSRHSRNLTNHNRTQINRLHKNKNKIKKNCHRLTVLLSLSEKAVSLKIRTCFGLSQKLN